MVPHGLAWLVVAVAGAAMLVATAEDLAEAEVAPRDEAVAAALAPLRAQPARDVMVVVSAIGSFTLVAPLSVLLAAYLAHRGARREALRLLSVVLAVSVLTELAKAFFARPRPLGALATGFGFPSGHASTAAALACLAVALLARHPRGKRVVVPAIVVGIGWCVLVGASRMALGAHYFSDVVGGLGLGLFVGGLGVGGAEWLSDLLGPRLRLGGARLRERP